VPLKFAPKDSWGVGAIANPSSHGCLDPRCRPGVLRFPGHRGSRIRQWTRRRVFRLPRGSSSRLSAAVTSVTSRGRPISTSLSVFVASASCGCGRKPAHIQPRICVRSEFVLTKEGIPLMDGGSLTRRTRRQAYQERRLFDSFPGVPRVSHPVVAPYMRA
jgi:hypothetical protein